MAEINLEKQFWFFETPFKEKLAENAENTYSRQ